MKKLLIFAGVVVCVIIYLKQPENQTAPPSMAAEKTNDSKPPAVKPETFGLQFAKKYIHTSGQFQVLKTVLFKDTPPYKIYSCEGIVNGPGTSLPFVVLFTHDTNKGIAVPNSVDYAGRNVFDLDATIEASRKGNKER